MPNLLTDSKTCETEETCVQKHSEKLRLISEKYSVKAWSKMATLVTTWSFTPVVNIISIPLTKYCMVQNVQAALNKN